MKSAIAMCALALLITRPIEREAAFTSNKNIFVTWNVGQGLWTTWVEHDRCYHFDAGGEHAPWAAVRELCRGKQNLFSFSHWDMDHIDFIARAARALRETCILNPPQGEGSSRKRLLFRSLRPCMTDSNAPELIREIDRPPRLAPGAKHSNDLSRVFIIEHEVLAPGDSTKREEKDWAERIRGSSLKLLILGHHGSRTSTSAMLLQKLPSVKQAIASCRKARYGHPHAEVLARLKKSKIATISTEDWGSIFWESPAPRENKNQRR